MKAVALLVPLSLLAASAAAAAVSPAGGDGEQEHYLQNGGGNETPVEFDDYSNLLANLLRRQADKRSCIRRGNSCDARPHDCCSSGFCRCNLWGSNCKCARGSLFQTWGRR